MECHCIPPAELPHAALLYTTYLGDFSRLSEFYVHPPDRNGISRAAQEIRFENSLSRGVVDVLGKQNAAFGGDSETNRNLDRLQNGAAAVVTGQQVGLLGGPAFSVYKALTAIRLASELTASGTNAVPIFWLATEDHDLAEVNHCFFGSRAGLKRFDLGTPGAEGRRVGEISLGEADARDFLPRQWNGGGSRGRRRRQMDFRKLSSRGNFRLRVCKTHDAESSRAAD